MMVGGRFNPVGKIRNGIHERSIAALDGNLYWSHTLLLITIAPVALAAGCATYVLGSLPAVRAGRGGYRAEGPPGVAIPTSTI